MVTKPVTEGISSRVSARLQGGKRNNAAFLQESEKATCAKPSPLQARLCDLPTFAGFRAATVVMNKSLDNGCVDFVPANPRGAQPQAEVFCDRVQPSLRPSVVSQ